MNTHLTTIKTTLVVLVTIAVFIGAVTLVSQWVTPVKLVNPLGSLGNLVTFTGGTNSSSTISPTTDKIVLAANSNAFYRSVCNDSSNGVYLTLDATATMNIGILLNASSVASHCYEMKGDNLFLGAVHAIAATTSSVTTFDK